VSFRLTREVRFALNDLPDHQLEHPPANSFAGFPSLTGFGQYFGLHVTLEGKLDPKSCYLRNIKEIDRAVREKVIGALKGERELIHIGKPELAVGSFSEGIFASLKGALAGDKLHAITLLLTPFLSLTELASEFGMYTRLSQRFEFSAAHRLHNPALSDEENRRIYGKCNNPNGHGHNYELQVTLRGKPREDGLLVDIPAFEKIVKEAVIDRFDHKNLNLDVPEFRELIPTIENISMVIFRMLKNRFTGIGAELASVTVWETSKTWCEYSED
jgi:6-pyruvoyltetrahydropterin/6-carboxytetrahydropterin synthase